MSAPQRTRRSTLLAALPILLLIAALAATTVFASGGGDIPLTTGWYQGQSTYYYSFTNPIPSPDGGATVTPAPIYVLFHENGDPVAGQGNIVDVVPGEPGYSDLWQVHMVTVPNDYIPNTVTSYDGLVVAGYSITPTDTYVNCPIVPDGTMLQYSQQELVQGWYAGNPVYYFDLGMNPLETRVGSLRFHRGIRRKRIR